MKFGLDKRTGERVAPKTGLLVICPCCEAELISKCGSIRAHHWAHKTENNCDRWWETETMWHRKWKNRFPEDWQEIVMHDPFTGEKHIADVYNSKNDLVIEFQNSPIDRREIQSREKFYKKMIWVVNAEQFGFSISELGDWKVERKLRMKALKMRFDKNNEGAILLQKYHEDLKKYAGENIGKNIDESYIQYIWTKRKKNWENAANVFLDLGGEIVLIKSQFVAKRVPMDMFMNKYGN